jgi:hypothetical protein
MAIGDWPKPEHLPPRNFTCGYCGVVVGSDLGFGKACIFPSQPRQYIYFCPLCERPVVFHGDQQMPAAAFGRNVDHLPEDVAALYAEARNCMVVNAYTPAVLACRKLLMHVAVSQGAEAGENFLACVDYLHANGFVPKNAGKWLDYIRKRGNFATHQIALMKQGDAESLLTFIEMLLQLAFEFPHKAAPTIDAADGLAASAQ